MTRLTLALAALIGLVSVAPASLAPRRDRNALDSDAPLRAPASPRAARSPAEALRPANPAEYVVTEQTEILLDGQLCRFEDVPERAIILKMEVAGDGKTVVKILFRSQK
jgi:hypothetical protein